MSFIDGIKARAKGDIKKIVLPEGLESRIIEAAKIIADEGVAKVILLGNRDEIQSKVPGIDISKIECFDYIKDGKLEEYANQLYELRKEKGMTLEKATELVRDEVYYGVMMVHNGEADGMVSGSVHSTSDTLRPALQILKTAPGAKLVSAFFIMVLEDKNFGENGVYIYSDSGLVENPDAEQLSEIAVASCKSFRALVGPEPKVAMLSYSTYGSAKSELTDKVVQATALAKQKAQNEIIDGELQFDAAIIPSIGEFKAKGSPIKGRANVLIFPDLNCGNIAYKITERLGGALAYGPLIQGIKKPVNDLSRGSTVEDIEGVIAITAVQAQNINL